MDCGTIGVNDCVVGIFLCLVVFAFGFTQLGALLGFLKERVSLGYGVTVVVKCWVVVAYPAMHHAIGFHVVSKVSGAEGGSTICGFGGVVYNALKLLFMDVSGGVVMVAVPHDVFCGGSLTAALRVVANVGVCESCCMKSVRSSNAATYNGFEEAGVLWVISVVEGGVLLFEVSSGGFMVNMRCDANHVFSITRWFEISGSIRFGMFVLVMVSVFLFFDIGVILPSADTLFEVLKEGVSGRLFDAGAVVSFVGGVDGEGASIREGELNTAIVCEALGVYEAGRSQDSIGGPLWEFGRFTAVVLVVFVYFVAYDVYIIVEATQSVGIFSGKAPRSVEHVGDGSDVWFKGSRVVEDAEDYFKSSELR